MRYGSCVVGRYNFCRAADYFSMMSGPYQGLQTFLNVPAKELRDFQIQAAVPETETVGRANNGIGVHVRR